MTWQISITHGSPPSSRYRGQLPALPPQGLAPCKKHQVSLAHVAVGRAVARPSPARIPACGFLAPGSSDRLASASPTAIASSEVGTDDPAHHVRSVFPVKAASACQSLPHVNGATVSEYYELIRLPATVSSPTCLSARLTWTLARSGQGLPSPGCFSPRIPRSSWTPADPLESCPLLGFHCVGFPSVNTVAICS